MVKKVLFLGVGLVALILAIATWSYQGAIARIETQQKVVALTFDDGPNPPHTEELLGVLEKHGVVATFFPKAKNVEAFPDAAMAMVAAGHEIGNHSYHHNPMTSLSLGKMQDEIVRANSVLREVMGVDDIMLFRPPFGLQGIGTKRALTALNLKSILMSDSGFDWEEVDAQKIAETVLETVKPGSIILLHDGHGDVEDPHNQDSRAASVTATQTIIMALREQGFRFVTVSELLALEG